MKLGALLAVAVSFVSLSAFAADGDYQKFLTSMEGNWEGQGSAYNRSTGQSSSYNFQMAEFREGDQTTWMANIAKSSSMGGGQRDTVTFSILGNFLSINQDSIFGSGTVRFSTDHSIEYVFSTSEMGHFLDFTYRWDVSGDGLSGSLVVEQDGFRVYEEGWSAHKSHSSK